MNSRGTILAFLLAPAISLQACIYGGGVPPAERHLIYLHGAIVENQGPRGRHHRFGEFDLSGIAAALQAPGQRLLAEQRPRGTDPSQHADQLIARIRALLARGVRPDDITIVGASKGAVIAALVSTRLQEPDMRYVLMGNCNDWLIRTHQPRFSGHVLSIYDESDEIGGSCERLRALSPAVRSFEEVKLSTGLHHGFLYKALGEWVGPVRDWARSGRAP